LDDDEQEDNSAATTVYVAKNASNNLEALTKQRIQRNENSTTVGLVKKFLSTRESFLQALKKRSDLAGTDFGYSIIQRRNKETEQWSESSDYLPPSLPELIMVSLILSKN
jgi:hypothetical protein